MKVVKFVKSSAVKDALLSFILLIQLAASNKPASAIGVLKSSFKAL